jgi:hypothetical protein
MDEIRTKFAMNNVNMPKCLDSMVKWQPFASMPEQFAGIIDILNDLNKTKNDSF